MNADPLRQTVILTNPLGLHMRPMQALVSAAGKFQSSVQLWKDESNKVDGRSILNMMLLAAEQGTPLTVEVIGPDAAQALDEVLKVMDRISAGEFDDQ